jgi:signal peptidase
VNGTVYRIGRAAPRRVVVRAVTVALLAGAGFLFWPRVLGGAASFVIVSGDSMVPTLHHGDLVLLRARSDYAVGDVVAYHPPAGDVAREAVVIHRLTAPRAAEGFTARGDHNASADPWPVDPGRIIGARWFVLPGAGVPVAVLRSPLSLGLLAGVVGGNLMLSRTPGPRRPRAPGRRSRGPAALPRRHVADPRRPVAPPRRHVAGSATSSRCP